MIQLALENVGGGGMNKVDEQGKIFPNIGFTEECIK